MSILEASIHDLKRYSIDEQMAHYGTRILVMRHLPSWMELGRDIDLWIPGAAPSQPLLNAWRAHRVNWITFSQTYKHEQEQATHCRTIRLYDSRSDHKSPVDVISDLAMMFDKITLLCWEREPEPCHRHILIDLLEAKGAEVERKTVTHEVVKQTTLWEGIQ